MELEMVCVCDSDGVREAEARRLGIFRRMGLGDMEDLTTAIILSLAFDFQADAEVYADQWFGVSVETPILEGGVFVACDWPSDGLTAIWEHLAEKFPDRVSVHHETRAPRGMRGMPVPVTERISKALFAQYESAEGAYREHRASAHKDGNDCPPCEDCDVLMTLAGKAGNVLNESWGSRALDPAIDKAFG